MTDNPGYLDDRVFLLSLWITDPDGITHGWDSEKDPLMTLCGREAEWDWTVRAGGAVGCEECAGMIHAG